MPAVDDPYFSLPTKPEAGKRRGLDRLRSAGPIARSLRFVFFGLVGVVAVLILLGAWAAIEFHLDAAPGRTEHPARAVADSVADILADSEASGPIPAPDPEHSARRKALAREIRDGRGTSTGDGFHNDGTDWYEVDLSPELAAKLRADLPRSLLFRPASSFPARGRGAPAWWPTAWPDGSTCHQHRLIHLILPPTGTRLWVQVIRT